MADNTRPVTLPYFWRSWMWRLDPFTYLIEGLVSTVLQDVVVVCKPTEFHRFNPPSGQTCMEWAGKFAEAMGAYINNPNATSDCEYCQYQKGQNFFSGLSISFANRWRDVGIFIAYVVFNILVLLAAARFLRWQKR